MKLFKYFILPVIITAFPTCNADAAISLCLSQQNCQTMCKSGQYCCLTGETRTTKKCPAGWTVNGSYCTRSPISGLSDNTGYYTQNYGSCTPTTVTEDCYQVSSTSSVYVNGVLTDCMFCINAGGLL